MGVSSLRSTEQCLLEFLCPRPKASVCYYPLGAQKFKQAPPRGFEKTNTHCRRQYWNFSSELLELFKNRAERALVVIHTVVRYDGDDYGIAALRPRARRSKAAHGEVAARTSVARGREGGKRRERRRRRRVGPLRVQFVGAARRLGRRRRRGFRVLWRGRRFGGVRGRRGRRRGGGPLPFPRRDLIQEAVGCADVRKQDALHGARPRLQTTRAHAAP